jgi:hypothetical protein
MMDKLHDTNKETYENVTKESGIFKNDAIAKFSKDKKLHQIWRDNLLVLQLLKNENYAEGSYIFLYPALNKYCHNAITEYIKYLKNPDWHCQGVTLETMISTIKAYTDAKWICDLEDRYLGFIKDLPEQER